MFRILTERAHISPLVILDGRDKAPDNWFYGDPLGRSREGCPVCRNKIGVRNQRHVESFEDFAKVHLKTEWQQVRQKIRNRNQKVLMASELVSVSAQCPEPLREFFDFALMRFREHK